MKRLFRMTAFVIILSLFSPAPALAATLSLSPSSNTMSRGCETSLEVVLDTQGTQTDGTDAILIYDPSRFSISTASITSNTNVYPDFPGNNVDEASGKITISGLASVSTPFTGKGTLATLRFSVKDSAPTGVTQINFDFDPNNKAKTIDSNVVERTTIVDVLNSVVNGSYTIGTSPCNPLPTVTPTPRPGTPGYVVPGPGGQGAVYMSTPSGTYTPPTTYIPVKTLPEGGTKELTFTLAIFGSVLTILGILGLALL